MASWFEDFILDGGRTATVEWSWDETEGASVVSAWEKSDRAFDNEIEVALSDVEMERFNEQVISLRPFPPHEYDYSIDLID